MNVPLKRPIQVRHNYERYSSSYIARYFSRDFQLIAKWERPPVGTLFFKAVI